jgi:hypothetical protein
MVDQTPLILGGYTLANLNPSDLIPNERARIMAVDVQGGEFWVAIRAFDHSGNSKLLYAGKQVLWSDLDSLQLKYKVLSQMVMVDVGWNTQVVLAEIAKRKWIGLNGTKAQSYSWFHNGRDIERIYSQPIQTETATGTAVSFHFSTNGAKDIFAQLKAGRLGNWDLPSDLPDAYKKHLSVWYQSITVDPRTKKQTTVWATTSDQEHLADCELMAMIGAILAGIKLSAPI